MIFIPEIGMKGTLKVKAPFDSLIDPAAFYECITLETLASSIANGETPFETYYEPLGLTEQDVQADLAAGAKLVTVQCMTGIIVTIPSTYIESIPDANGVTYHCVMLGVALSVIPDTQDLSSLKQDIMNLVESRLGVKSKIEEVVYGPPTLIAQSTHLELQTLRASRVASSSSDAALVIMYKEQLDKLREQTAMLEQYIANQLSHG